jgi:hypothetical protein
MTKQEVMAMLPPVMATAIKELREYLSKDIAGQVERAMVAYRKSVTIKDRWCCNEMVDFATKFWGAAVPNLGTFHTGGEPPIFGTSYQIRGSHVNFCPFCGVKIGT